MALRLVKVGEALRNCGGRGEGVRFLNCQDMTWTLPYQAKPRPIPSEVCKLAGTPCTLVVSPPHVGINALGSLAEIPWI